MDLFTNCVCKQPHNPQGLAIHKFTAELQTCEQPRPRRRKILSFLLEGGHFNLALTQQKRRE